MTPEEADRRLADEPPPPGATIVTRDGRKGSVVDSGRHEQQRIGWVQVAWTESEQTTFVWPHEGLTEVFDKV